MKKNTFILLAFATLLASCQREMTEVGLFPKIIAEIESPSGTRTQLSVDESGVGAIHWKPADQIDVFFGTTRAVYSSQNNENATTATFQTSDSVSGTDISSTNIWGLYPSDDSSTCDGNSVTTTLPSLQYGTPDSFDDDLFITLAHSNSTTLQFYNVCGGIKFNLSRDDIKSITLKGNNNEDLAGKVKLSFSDGLPESTVVNGVKEITLRPKSGQSFSKGVNYYFVTLPVTLSAGFTMTFTTKDGAVGTLNYTAKSITLKRSVFSKKAQIDSFATFEGSSSPDPIPTPVDLGLPSKTLWASMNVGASKPSEIGGRFAWGETKPKTYYDWDNYKWCNGTENSLTKYCTQSSYGNVDGKVILDDEDDVAQVRLGTDWRMPSCFELNELLSECSWQTSTLDGISGYRVTGPNGNSIFFPNNGQFDDYGITWASYVFLWSNETTGTNNAYRLQYPGSSSVSSGNNKHDGLCVRAVYNNTNSTPTKLSIQLDVAGTLSDKLKKYDCDVITDIKISGLMDARDFDFIKWECTSIETVDLSDVRIVEYTGEYGTNEGYEYTYPADEIPLGAFFYWTTHRRRDVTNGFSDEGMPSLKRVVLPKGIKAIERNAFARAYHLSEINFPEGLDRIDYVAFNLSFSLKNLSFPSTLKSIGQYAFFNSNDLQEVHCKALTPPTINNTWGWVEDGDSIRGWLSDEQRQARVVPILYVPNESLSLYKKSEWALFFTNIQSEEIISSTPEAVDLGLSVKWASFNLGATKPEEYGDYFAWGETEPKDSYSWSTYKWCKGSLSTLTKYCFMSSSGYNGFTDDKTILDLEDDAAHVNWGGNWRMPTDAELTELREECSWVWTLLNGVNGQMVIGPNGNSIFLPATGRRVSNSLTEEGVRGHYWSSSLISETPTGAWRVDFDSDTVKRRGNYVRFLGFTIRPVFDD